MKKLKNRSVVPIYLVGLVWFLYALLFPLYRLTDYIVIIILSVISYFASTFLISTFSANNKFKNVDTGDPYTDEMLIDALKNADQIRLLRNSIMNENARARIKDLEQTADLIISNIKANPDKCSKASQFFLYYLPTTVKLIKRYEELEMPGQTGDHLNEGMHKIEEFLDKLVEAYHKMLDNLFGDHTAGATIDIEVMEKMLQQDNYLEK